MSILFWAFCCWKDSEADLAVTVDGDSDNLTVGPAG